MRRTQGLLVFAALVLVAALVWLAWPARERTDATAGAAAGATDGAPPVPPTAEAEPASGAARSEREASAAPPVLPAARSELRGIVRAQDGTPLAGASVVAWRLQFRGFDLRLPATADLPEHVARAESDASGEFRIALGAGERVDIEAWRQELCPAFATDLAAGDFVELVLRAGLRVRGRITRARDGAPVARASVTVEGPSHGAPESALSAEDGTYVLRVASADARLRVWPEREQSTPLLPLSFDADGLCLLDVALEDGARVEGRVTDRDTGQPIARARVDEGRKGRRHATTDERGEYVLLGFGNPDVAELHATAPGYGKARGLLTVPVDGHMRVDFALARARRARGRVADERAGPVEGARVLAVAHADANDDWRGAQTEADGSFAIADLAPELRHALLIAAPGHATQVYDFPADEHERMEIDLGTFVLRDARALRGRVLDEGGAGVAGVTVSLSGWNADRFALSGNEAEPAGTHYVAVRARASDARGRFAFEDLPAGEYTLGARAPGTPSPPEQRLEVVDADLEAQIALPSGRGIRGIALDEQGRPLAELRVNLSVEELRDPAAEPPRLSASTGPDGAFEFRGLPDGLYALELFPTRFGPEDLRTPLLAAHVEHVAAGAAPLRVELQRGLTIEGVLQDAHGAALGDHNVRALGADGAVGWEAYTDASGRFAMPVARGTTWTLEVFAPGQLEGAPLHSLADVAAGTLDVSIELP